ncbi:MAG: hypothetical protein Q8K30_02430 [Candidatus Gracilibacteria bacterium]|nr:hypothetical protein [Candidatus Gracilibacteria bacterium]MDP3381350.1 hypothetical protein [bacterium]
MEKLYTREELDKIMYDYIRESANQIKKELLNSNKDLKNKKLMYV